MATSKNCRNQINRFTEYITHKMPRELKFVDISKFSGVALKFCFILKQIKDYNSKSNAPDALVLNIHSWHAELNKQNLNQHQNRIGQRDIIMFGCLNVLNSACAHNKCLSIEKWNFIWISLMIRCALLILVEHWKTISHRFSITCLLIANE